jgi:uncharacterized protein YndB with AHSA1/START domain
MGTKISRRGAFATVGMAWCGAAFATAGARAESVGEVSYTSEAIHQEPVIKASRQRVYEALTVTSQFDKVIEISGAKKVTSLGSEPTQISTEIGGPFVIFLGHIIGRQIQLVPNQLIVQAWRVVDWQPGIYSIARYELTESSDGTRVIFDHTGFPKGLGTHLADGWRGHYWDPLAKLLA